MPLYGASSLSQRCSFDKIVTLKDIDLDIKKGEFVIIVGKVGAGKTSLLNAITGEMLYLPD